MVGNANNGEHTVKPSEGVGVSRTELVVSELSWNPIMKICTNRRAKICPLGATQLISFPGRRIILQKERQNVFTQDSGSRKTDAKMISQPRNNSSDEVSRLNSLKWKQVDSQV